MNIGNFIAYGLIWAAAIVAGKFLHAFLTLSGVVAPIPGILAIVLAAAIGVLVSNIFYDYTAEC